MASKINLISECNFIFLQFQVIALSKQQGLLHSPRSEDGGSIRYRALTDQDPSPPASTTGALGGGLYTLRREAFHRFTMDGVVYNVLEEFKRECNCAHSHVSKRLSIYKDKLW